MTVNPEFGTWEPVRFRGKIGFEGVRCKGVPLYIKVLVWGTVRNFHHVWNVMLIAVINWLKVVRIKLSTNVFSDS